MIGTRILCGLGIIVAILVGSAVPDAAAEDKKRDLVSVNRLRGQVVYLLDNAGRETLVRVVAASDTQLTALVGGLETRFPVSDIRRISIHGRDSVKNGALIGASIGFVLGALAAEADDYQRPSAVSGGLASATVFGAVGAWIDHRRDGRTTVYEGP
jgi:hypothetical protein